MSMQWSKAVFLAGMAFLAGGVAAWGEAGRGGTWGQISQDAILSVRNDESVRWIAEKMPSVDSGRERVVFLEEVIADADGKENVGSGEKSAALWLLGACGGREAVPVLLANLEWKDEVRHEMPAVVSLVAIGEDAVEGLLGVVFAENETDARKDLAVEALEGIKGAGFEAFLREQRNVRGDGAALQLFIHAVD